jgi:DmsE family decaheme c-type cytochrome
MLAALGFGSGTMAADAPQLPELGATQATNPAQDSLARDAVCTKCHDENDNKPILAIYQTKHGVKSDARTPSCQSCHGTSDKHVKNPEGTSPRPTPEIVFGAKLKVKTASTPDLQNVACLTCHKAGLRVNWSGSEHQNHDLACSTCHQVHAPVDKVLVKLTQPEVCETCHQTQRAQLRRISTHPVAAGEMTCSDCHNPHGSSGPKLLVKNSINETCYTCHAEKRGPFLWEHAPVRESCLNCHTPHGSTNPPLLKQRVPFLCQDCHTADHGSGINSGANLPNGNVTTANGVLPPASQSPRAQTNARACLNCHVLVHGSNHPAGAKFQR